MKNDLVRFIKRSRSQRRLGRLHVATFLVAGAFLTVARSTASTPSTQTASTPATSPGTAATPPTAGSPALKQIDQAALKTMVDKIAKELLVPVAVVLLRTPQGEFTVAYGTTLLGATSPPSAGTYFRTASNTN
jgi:D-alanyl-D-alanine carboxypeptidase